MSVMKNVEKRASKRNQLEAPLQFKIPKSEALAATRLYNVGQGGVYFESPWSMLLNSETTIVIPDISAEPTVPGVYTGYRARIRWCNELPQKHANKYGIGAQFLRQAEELTKVAGFEEHCTECDLCDKSLEGNGICVIDGSRCLCIPCYEHLGSIPDGPLRASIMRYIDRNVI
jgi:hypothetical protein